VRSRRRIPLAYAGLLIVTLLAVIGAAAFSTGTRRTTTTATVPIAATLATTAPISARVASAVFALAVTPAATPAPPPPSTTTSTAELATAGAELATPLTEALPAPTTTTAAPTTTTTTRPRDTTPPALAVTSPKDGATVSDRIVRFQGTTEPGAEVFSGPYAADVDGEGDWILPLVVAPGANGAVFTARDAAGNETTIRIVVTYAPPTTTTTHPPHTTTTTKPKTTTTTTAPPATEWSPQWPADPAGKRDVEAWRPLVTQYWPADRVDCVLGIIRRESRGDPQARNPRYDTRGLLQHMVRYWPGRARGAGFVDENGLVADPYNAEANIAAGAYLANWYDHLGRNWWSPWSGDLPDYGNCLADAG